MAEVQELEIGTADTETLRVVVSGNRLGVALADLSDLTSGKAYFREVKRDGDPGEWIAPTNHIDGAATTVVDSDTRTVGVPVKTTGPSAGPAFAVSGRAYDGYLRLVWSDGDVTRHPGRLEDFLRVTTAPTLE